MVKYLRFEYLFIFMVIVWDPFQRYILKVDGGANTIALLAITVLFISFRKKIFHKLIFTKPIFLWFIWILYSFLNTIIVGYSSDLPISSFFLNISIPLLLMLVICMEFIRNEDRVINVIISGLYIAVILTLFFAIETFEGRIGGAMNSNTIGIMSTVLCMLIYYKTYKRQIKISQFAVLIIVPLFAIISTGSRTAFDGVLLLFALHFFLNRSRYILFTLLKIVLGALFLFLPFNYILENTGLGERIMSTTKQSEGMTFETGNEMLDKFGDRGFFYYRGWEVFKEHPITGIGLENFKNYNHLELAQHSEYMIQLTELGLIGFILFILFYASIFKNLKIIKKVYNDSFQKREIELFISYLLIILLMITATRMYRVWFLFVIVGIVVGYIHKERLNSVLKNEELMVIKENE